MNKNCPFSIEFQYSLLKLFLQDEVLFTKASKFLEQQNPFETEILWFFYNLAFEHQREHNKLPCDATITNEIKKIDPNVREKYIRVYQEIKNANIDNKDYILSQLEPFIKAFYFVNTQEDMADIYNSNPEKAYSVIDDLAKKIHSVQFHEDDVYQLNDIFDVLDEQGKETKNRIRTGIAAFDKVLGGGAGAGEVFTFLARDGVGKSMCLMNIGALALEDGKKVLHVHCEGKKVQPLLRYTTRLSNIEYNKVRNNQLTEEEKLLISETNNKLNDNLIIKPFLSINGNKASNNTGTTIEDLVAYCAELYKKFKFDVVIVDYGDKLETRSKTEANRFVSEVVWSGLELIGAEFNVPVYTATQSVRVKGAGSKLLVKEDMAESSFKSRLSSYVVSINRTPTDIKNHVVKFLLGKNREDETNIVVTCVSDYARCRTHLDDNQSARNVVDEESHDELNLCSDDIA